MSPRLPSLTYPPPPLSKGAIRFAANKILSAALVKNLVKDRAERTQETARIGLPACFPFATDVWYREAEDSSDDFESLRPHRHSAAARRLSGRRRSHRLAEQNLWVH